MQFGILDTYSFAAKIYGLLCPNSELDGCLRLRDKRPYVLEGNGAGVLLGWSFWVPDSKNSSAVLRSDAEIPFPDGLTFGTGFIWNPRWKQHVQVQLLCSDSKGFFYFSLPFSGVRQIRGGCVFRGSKFFGIVRTHLLLNTDIKKLFSLSSKFIMMSCRVNNVPTP